MASAGLMRLRYAGWPRNAGDVMVVAIGDNQTDEECYPSLPKGSVTVHVNGAATNAVSGHRSGRGATSPA